MGEHGLHPEPVEVVDRRAQAHGLRRHRHARLEPLRRRGVGRPLHPHQLDHRPAGEERRHRREQLAPPPQHADPGRAEHLVPGERREVDAQRGEVHRLVRHRLAGVEQRQRPDGPGPRHQLRDRQHGAQHVALVRERHDLRALATARASRGPAGRRRVTPYHRRTAPVRRHSSCHGTRFAWCSSSVTTISSPGSSANRADSGPSAVRIDALRERVGDEVDPLGGVLGEHHLVRVGPDERRDPRAGRLVGVGGLLGELVRAAVHRGVVLLEERPLGVEHLPRPLGGRPRVEVDQGAAAADGPGQDREVGPDRRRCPAARGPGPARPGRSSDRGRGDSAAPVYLTYPSASSSSASSAPPEATIRPPAKTCTTSGVMWLRMRV